MNESHILVTMRDVKSEILSFWFEETQPKQWFQKNDEFDDVIIKRFGDSYDLAMQGIFDSWRETPEGVLALVILLDQFPRNMFRNNPRAFATDSLALEFSRQAIDKKFDILLEPMKRRFLYLPFEHSENIKDQELCVELFETIKDEDPTGYEYAIRHKDIIERFERFPHRNEILGRISTEEEIAFLKTAGSSF